MSIPNLFPPSESFGTNAGTSVPSFQRHQSRISSLLRSNQAPAHEEISSMRSCLADTEARIEAIKLRTEELERELKSLHHEKGTLQGYASDQKIVLNPIRRLPADVLNGIFSVCLEQHTDPDDPIFYDASNTQAIQWVLSHVCRYWRYESVRSPRLWCNIQISVFDGNAMVSNKIMLLGLHLQRSQNLPLTIGLFGGYSQAVKNHPLLLHLLSFAERWEVLYTSLKPLECLQKSLLQAKLFLTSLRTLKFYNIPWSTSPTSLSNLDIFCNARSLETLGLVQTCVILPLLDLPWKNLHILIITNPQTSLLNLASVLKHTTKLEHLCISQRSLYYIHEETLENKHSIRLPALRILEFSISPILTRTAPPVSTTAASTMGYHNKALCHLLGALVLPKLAILIDAEDDTETWVSGIDQRFSALLSLTQRSRCQLTSFTSFSTISRNDFRRLVDENPVLEHIYLPQSSDVVNLTNDELKALKFELDSKIPEYFHRISEDVQ